MSEKCDYPTKKGLKKVTNFGRIYLGYGRDLCHGKGWFSGVFTDKGMGFGFHKTNKLTAVRLAIKGN